MRTVTAGGDVGVWLSGGRREFWSASCMLSSGCRNGSHGKWSTVSLNRAFNKCMCLCVLVTPQQKTFLQMCLTLGSLRIYQLAGSWEEWAHGFCNLCDQTYLRLWEAVRSIMMSTGKRENKLAAWLQFWMTQIYAPKYLKTTLLRSGPLSCKPSYVRNRASHLLYYSLFPPAFSKWVESWSFIHSGQEHRNCPQLFPLINPLFPTNCFQFQSPWVHPASPCTTAEASAVSSFDQYICTLPSLHLLSGLLFSDLDLTVWLLCLESFSGLLPSLGPDSNF